MTLKWNLAGIYFEACNCDSVCPCYSWQAPTYGYCEGNCAWHINKGRYGDVSLDGLNVIMVQHCDGPMSETKWRCWYYIDDRATNEQFDALKQIFTAAAGGHIGKFSKLWGVQRVERAKIVMKIEGWQHRASVLNKLGLAIGILRTDAGPVLCPIPNVTGIAAIAEENWFSQAGMEFNYKNKNALTTTFKYYSDQ